MIDSTRSRASTNYFESRTQAGDILADIMQKYKYEDTIVLALSSGGVLVGAEIARKLHSLIALLLTKDIYLPDGQTVIGVMDELGGFIYDNSFSSGQIEELYTEYRGSIEMAKMQALHEMHVALGQGGIISPDYFRNRIVIVVNDGALNGMAFNMAYSFLKTIAVKKIIMVTPIASVSAVDRMHVIADEINCLSVTENPFEVDHYYDDNKLPDQDEVIDILNDIILLWQQPATDRS